MDKKESEQKLREYEINMLLKRKKQVPDWIEDFGENHPGSHDDIDKNLNRIVELLTSPENIHGQRQRPESLVAGALYITMHEDNPDLPLTELTKEFINRGYATSSVSNKTNIARIITFFERNRFVSKPLQEKRNYIKHYKFDIEKEVEYIIKDLKEEYGPSMMYGVDANEIIRDIFDVEDYGYEMRLK